MKSITGNLHAVQEIQNRGHCPVCLTKGIAVPQAVLQSMLKRELRSQAREGYQFCSGPACPVAYFDDDVLIDVTEVTKRITRKDAHPETLVCYCLQVSRGTILQGIKAGTIQSSQDARRETKACTGKACHIVNPGGICCGDELRDTVVDGLAAIEADATSIEQAQMEDPGSKCCGRTLEKVLRGDAKDGCHTTHCKREHEQETGT